MILTKILHWILQQEIIQQFDSEYSLDLVLTSAELGWKTFSSVCLVVSGLSRIDWAHERFSILKLFESKILQSLLVSSL